MDYRRQIALIEICRNDSNIQSNTRKHFLSVQITCSAVNILTTFLKNKIKLYESFAMYLCSFYNMIFIRWGSLRVLSWNFECSEFRFEKSFALCELPRSSRTHPIKHTTFIIQFTFLSTDDDRFDKGNIDSANVSTLTIIISSL